MIDVRITVKDILWLVKEKVKKIFKRRITEPNNKDSSTTGALIVDQSFYNMFKGIPGGKIYCGGKIKCKK